MAKEYEISAAIEEGEAPFLLSTHGHENEDEDENEPKTQTFCSFGTKTRPISYIKNIPELNRNFILGSIMGWLVLRDDQNHRIYSLWNPITRQLIPLPELLDLPDDGETPVCRTFVFTSSPDHHHHHTANSVFLFFCKSFVFSCMPNARDKDRKWVKQCLEYEGHPVDILKAASINGDIYAYAYIYDHGNSDRRYVSVFHGHGGDNGHDRHVTYDIIFARLKVVIEDEDDNNYSYRVVFEALKAECPSSKTSYDVMTRQRVNYLVEMSGVLYAADIILQQFPNILKAIVWKLDLSKMEWVQVESIGGDRALLLGLNCSTWCWADNDSRIEGNCFYMVKISSDVVHQYRLQDTGYVLLPSDSDFTFCLDGPTWFMPYNPTRLTCLVEEAEKESTKNVEEMEEKDTELFKLPSEVLVSIADRLHWFDCMNFRVTCRTLRCKIPKPQWKANASLPLFMFLSNNEGKCELWDPCYQNNGGYVTKKLPYSPLVVSTIEYCKDDWLLLRSHGGFYLQYLNLFTGERGEYPTKSPPYNFSNFLFLTCPTSPDCVTLGIGSLAHLLKVTLIVPGEKEWDTLTYEIDEDVDFVNSYNTSPKYYNKAFYFLSNNGNLGIFKMMEAGICTWEVHKGPLLEEEDEPLDLNECYIAELDGQLVYVFIRDVGSKVEVYRFDIEQKLWDEVECLGDYMLFVSSASSFSVPAKDSSMRNRIYVPKCIANEMVFYSLDTGKYHTSSSTESFDDFHGMISQSFSCWV